jgi:hypothetical protein
MGILDWVVLIAELILGLCLCFAGYKFKNTILWVVWFAVGYLLVKQFGPSLISDYKILFLAEILGGLILAVFSFDLTVITEYLLGFFTGFILVTSFTGYTLLGIILGIVVGLILAMVSYKFTKYIIILATSYIGATLVAPFILTIFKALTIKLPVLTMILFVVGAVVQLLTNRSRESYEDD